MSASAARLIDLSRVIEDGMITDPRLAPARVREVWSREASASRYAPGVSFQMASVEMVQATGTYIDAPWHRHAADSPGAPESVARGGPWHGVWDIPLDKLADLPGVCVDVRERVRKGERRLGPEIFEGVDLRGRAALVCTGYDTLWSEPKYREGTHPFITEEAAKLLVQNGAALYGVDTLNADDFTDMRRPVHSVLLGAPPDTSVEPTAPRATPGICIVENLTGLEALIGKRFRFTAAPPKVRAMGSFPVRAWAAVSE